VTSRERIEKTWDFEEPDRVPFELYIMPEVKDNPLCAGINDLIEKYADNWSGWGPSWGWFGLDIVDQEEWLDHRPDDSRMKKTTRHTAAGDFTQITRHPTSTTDFHYEKHFISTLEDLDRLTRADRKRISGESFNSARFVDRFVTTSLPHPFGQLARHTDQITCYTWFATEPDALHAFFDAYTRDIIVGIDQLMQSRVPLYFTQLGLEMAIDPWMSPEMLERFVAPYDSRINERVHDYGGKIRHHCHGNVMGYLETFCGMGLDGTEPLEPPPQANVDLKRAKELVGNRMLLCGNIPSPQFQTADPEETREQVKQAIAAAAPGGGFVLRPTGGDAGTWEFRNLENVVANCEMMIQAALDYGTYPIRM
jgi:hypothetical protein